MISLYSFFMAILWFSLFVLAGTFLQRRTGLIFWCRLTPLLVLSALTVFRLIVPVELPYTRVLNSTELYPWVQSALRKPWIIGKNGAVSGIVCLLGLWAAVSVLLCIRLIWHLYKDHETVKDIPAMDCPGVEQSVRRVSLRCPSLKKVRLVVSPTVSAPMLVGLVRPVILLPAVCLELSEEELDFIFTHEWRHLSSGDLWVKLAVRILCCLMWWNPCVYILQKDLEMALEYKCDLAVTKPMNGGERVRYLQTILDILKRLEKKEPTQVLQACFCGITEGVAVKRRFQLVLHQEHRNGKASALALVAVSLLLFLGSYSVLLQPSSEPPAEDLMGEVFVTPENAYILAASNGLYYLVLQGEKWDRIPPENLQTAPYRSLTVKEEDEHEETSGNNDPDWYAGLIHG